MQGGRRGELLERERDLAALDAALEAAREGSGRAVFVEAHAGLGKTRLLEEAGRLAEAAGIEPAAASASELERNHPFGLALQLLERLLRAATEAEREEAFGGAAALARPLFTGDALGAPEPDARVFELLHGLYWLTSNLAERRPLLVAVDDLHWADRCSLRYLCYLAQRLDGLPVALVTSARPAEPSAHWDLVRELKSLGDVVRPGPLSPAGVKAVVRSRMPRAQGPFIDACGAVTEGNPYLLNELLADLSSKAVTPTAAHACDVGVLAPDSVLQAALGRIGRLPEGSAALARSAAVLSDDATLHRAAELAGIDVDTAAAAANALAAAEILAPGEPLRFVHPLLQAAIYSDIPAADRSRAHAHVARLMARDGAGPDAVAAHLLDAPRARDPWTVDQLRKAAERALAQGAADSAAGYLRRALQEPPLDDARADVLIELARAEALGGSADSLARFDEALGLIDDPRRRAAVLEELGWTLQKSGDVHGAVDAFARGLAELDSAGEGEGSGLAVASLQIAHLGAALLDPEHAKRAQARVDALLRQPAGALSATERGLVSIAAAHKLFAADSHDEVIDLSLRVWDDGRLLDDTGPESPTVWHVVGCLSWADALDASEDVIEAALAAAEEEGSIVTRALALYSRSWARYWRGQLSDAAADAEAAVAAWSGEFSMYLPVAAYWLAIALVELEDVEGAARAVDIPDAEQRWGDTNMYGPLLAGQGVVAMARDRNAEAVELFRRAGETPIGLGVPNPAVLPWRSYLSAALLATGDGAGAADAAAEELALARRFGSPRPLGIALRASGMAAGGRPGAAVLREAVAVLRTSPSRLELVRALIDLGAVLRRGGERVAAREPLREALALAERLGAVALERRARDEIVASGAKPRRRSVTGVEALTPSERRVAEMAAAGKTNREIAQRLFVTVQAVRWHLRNAYRKLEISSRDDLGAALDKAAETGEPTSA